MTSSGAVRSTRGQSAEGYRTCVIHAVLDVTPRVRRLILRGSAIPSFATPTGALGPYLKLRLTDDEGAIRLRTYSIRYLDAQRSEMHVDVVRHAGDSLGGTFVEFARAGTEVSLAGPGFIHTGPCGAYLLAGDHTALPAIAHILASLPVGPAVHAILEVPDAAEQQPFRVPSGARVTWLHRADHEPSRLAETVCRACQPDGDELFVWAGAEAAIARAIRRHARSCGIPAARCQVLNYWKRGQPEGAFSYVA